MSGRKNVLVPQHIINSVSMGANIASAAYNFQFQDNVGIQVSWTSSDAVGVIAVEASLDGVNYFALTFNPALSQPASDSGGYLIDINQSPFVYHRLTYTRTSGTGTLNAYLTCKEV